MAATFHLSIITPEECLYQGEIESLIAPGTLGYLGVLAHHAPLLTGLTEGTLTFRDSQETVHHFQVNGGILDVREHDTVILADQIEKTVV